MKKIIAIALSLATIFSLFAFGTSATAEKTEKEPLRFNEDGTFKILQISDIQDILIFKPLNRIFFSDLIDREKPDVIVLTGDNIAPGFAFMKWMTEKNIDNFMKLFEEKQVPVAIVYGNHDSDRNCTTKEEQWEFYEKYNCFIGVRDSEELTGYGTYYLPVLGSKDDKHKFTLWMFDSQEYNIENDLGGYGCVGKDQVEWYKKTETALTKANGGKKIPSFAFQHIIIPEVYEVLVKISETDAETGKVTEFKTTEPYLKNNLITECNVTYGFPEEYADEDTYLSETCCSPRYSNGQAAALLEYGNVLGIASGHDHKNSFVIPYKGLDIVQTPTASFGSYGDHNRGARIITLNEKNLDEYETDVIFFRDYYDIHSDEKLYNRYVMNSDFDEYSVMDRIKAAFKYYFSF